MITTAIHDYMRHGCKLYGHRMARQLACTQVQFTGNCRTHAHLTYAAMLVCRLEKQLVLLQPPPMTLAELPHASLVWGWVEKAVKLTEARVKEDMDRCGPMAVTWDPCHDIGT